MKKRSGFRSEAASEAKRLQKRSGFRSEAASFFGKFQRSMLASVTFDIPQELAQRLRPLQGSLPRILELGLREFDAVEQSGFEGAAEVLEFLANLPTPEEIIRLRPSDRFQARISELLEKNRRSGLTPDEEREWEHYQYLEHLVRIAKAKAYAKLNKS